MGELGGSGFDISRDLLCVTDADGRFVSLNAAWERLLGFSREELKARPFIEFVHPDDHDATLAQAAKVNQADYEIAEFVNRYRTKHGSYRWLRWSARSDGETWFAIAYDVTADRAREEELRAALDDEHLLAYSQPILDQRSGRVSHEELLARLRTDTDDVLAPAEFLPEAERLGLVGIVDRWMLAQALAVVGEGRPATVNLSAVSIDDGGIVADVVQAVEGLPAGAPDLIFEITETAAIEHLDAARELTDRLHPLGCRFALDDFGTGFGSLTYLRHLPVQFLKIDSSFIRDLTSSGDDRALVRSVVAIASEMGLHTVAEGVEDGRTLGLLRQYGVDHAQGYLIGKPEPVTTH